MIETRKIWLLSLFSVIRFLTILLFFEKVNCIDFSVFSTHHNFGKKYKKKSPTNMTPIYPFFVGKFSCEAQWIALLRSLGQITCDRM